MAEQQSGYIGRIEKQLETLSSKVDALTEKVIDLNATNNAYKSQSETNAKDIDGIKKDVSFARGAVYVCLLLLSLAGAAVAWAFSSITALQQRASDINTQVSISQSKLLRIDTDINALNQRVSAIERKEQP